MKFTKRNPKKRVGNEEINKLVSKLFEKIDFWTFI